MSDVYELYVIKTEKKINDILAFLKKFVKSSSDVVGLRKIYSRNKDTKEYIEEKQRFLFAKKEFIEKMKEKYINQIKKDNSLIFFENTNLELDDTLFPITPYVIKKEDFSHCRSSVSHYYFPCDSKDKNIKIFEEKMKLMEKLGIITGQDWFLHKLDLRYTTEDKKIHCICEFSKKVCIITRIKMKLIFDTPSQFRISWCRHSLFDKIERNLDN